MDRRRFLVGSSGALAGALLLPRAGLAAESGLPAGTVASSVLDALLLWFALYLAAYTAVHIDYYEWYMAPLYPVLAIFVGAGLNAFIGLLAPHCEYGAPDTPG